MKQRLVILFLVVATVVFLARLIPVGIDYGHFRYAGRSLVNGVLNDDPIYFNAPWLSAILIPISVQDDATGNALLLVCGLVAFSYVAYRFGASPATMILFVFSPGVVANLVLPNLDWIPLLGTLLSPPLGLFLVLVKPQVGIGVAILWFYQAWKQHSIIVTFAPVSIALVLSVALCGPWFLRSTRLMGIGWNTSLFPASLPFGLLLLAIALVRSRIDWATAASVLCSPYVSNTSWVGVFPPFFRSSRWMLAISAFWWIDRMLWAMWH